MSISFQLAQFIIEGNRCNRAAMAEFERDIISERTKAGLTAARARGRVGGRPKGLSKAAEHKAIIAEQL